MLTKPSLTLKRRLKATPAQVFQAWTDPEKIVRWFGPKETAAGSVRAEVDVRPGGRYRMSFQTDDGERHQVGGVYREVVPDSRLVFTWAWHSTPERESLVTVTIVPDGDGTPAHAASRAVLRPEGARRPRARLDRHARQAGALLRLRHRGSDPRFLVEKRGQTCRMNVGTSDQRGSEGLTPRRRRGG